MHVIRWQRYFTNMIQHNFGVRGGAVGFGYKPESRALNSRGGHSNFSLI